MNKNRNRGYYRRQRSRAIKRKKNIVKHIRPWYFPALYPFDGMYSKNKIHCSCEDCSPKTNQRNSYYKTDMPSSIKRQQYFYKYKNWQYNRDVRQLEEMNNQIVEYYKDDNTNFIFLSN